MAIKNPSKVNEEGEQYIENKTDKTSNDVSNITDTASDKIKDLKQEQFDTDKSTLDPNANKNIAKGESQYGMFNNKDYSNTLKLARLADKYNNKPVEHMFSVGTRHTGGTRDMGTGYDRPKLETMETRAMNQAISLDTNQKQLAQALQNAANYKNLEAFKMAYQQLYGITLTDAQAKIEMRRFTHQTEVSTMVTKVLTEYNGLFQQYLGKNAVDTIMSMVNSGDQSTAMFLASVLTGGPAPELSDVYADKFLDDFRRNYKGNATTAAEIDAEAQNALNFLYQGFDTQFAAGTKRKNNWFLNSEDRKAGREAAKKY